MDNTTNTGCTGHQYRQQINLTVPMISNPNVIHLWEIESSGICHNIYIHIYIYTLRTGMITMTWIGNNNINVADAPDGKKTKLQEKVHFLNS